MTRVDGCHQVMPSQSWGCLSQNMFYFAHSRHSLCLFVWTAHLFWIGPSCVGLELVAPLSAGWCGQTVKADSARRSPAAGQRPPNLWWQYAKGVGLPRSWSWKKW